MSQKSFLSFLFKDKSEKLSINVIHREYKFMLTYNY